jgi:acyl-CoA thioesterase-1
MRASFGAALMCGALLSGCGKEQPRVADTTRSAPQDPALRTPHSALTRRKILFAGTSLTAGLGLDRDSAYTYLIQQKIDSAGLPFEAVNAGVSGETTAGLLERLDWLLRGDFDVLVIESGANDGLRAIDAAAIKRNLTEVVRRVKAGKPAALILLIQMEALPNYGRSYGTAFHDLYRDVAKSEGIRLLPFLLDGVAGVSRLNQSDGVHPNMEGEHIVAQNVWRGLLPILKARQLHR